MSLEIIHSIVVVPQSLPINEIRHENSNNNLPAKDIKNITQIMVGRKINKNDDTINHVLGSTVST